MIDVDPTLRLSHALIVFKRLPRVVNKPEIHFISLHISKLHDRLLLKAIFQLGTGAKTEDGSIETPAGAYGAVSCAARRSTCLCYSRDCLKY